jgi:virginiamycin B lyase
MAITEYEVSKGSRPRRLAVATDGTIYYSDFERGSLGHFDPATKKVEEWKSPGGEGSEPYGITVTSDGIVWYSETGVKPNNLVRFDPKTKSFSTTPVPSGGGVIRNMAATKDGAVPRTRCRIERGSTSPRLLDPTKHRTLSQSETGDVAV